MRKTIICVLCAVISFTGIAEAAGKSDTYDRAVAAYLSDKYAEALPLFQSAAKADTKNPRVHYYLALCYQQLDKDQNAAEEYAAAIANSRDPAFKEILEERLLRTKRRLGQAQAAKEEAAGSLSANHGPLKKVILFSTNWCSHCRKFKGAWEEAQNKLRSRIKFEHYNAEDPSAYKMVQKYRPKAYPTLVYLDSKNKVIENHADAPKSDEFIKKLQSLSQ